MASKYRVTKGFKFHARPQTGAYSCYILKEASTKVLVSTLKKEHRLGFPTIGQDSRIDLRGPSYGARKVGDFRHFQTKLGERITDEPWSLGIYPTTNVFIWTRTCIRVNEKNSKRSRSAEMTL